jgi:hypothetical protein
MQLFAGVPSKFHSKQVTFSGEELAKMLGDTSTIGTGRGTVPRAEGDRELSVVPGMLLNRLNPWKGLDDDQRKEFIAEFRHKSEAFGKRDLRLALMDEQGIDKALINEAGIRLAVHLGGTDYQSTGRTGRRILRRCSVTSTRSSG